MFTFVETPLFTRLVGGYLDDEGYRSLQAHLASHPRAGKVVPGSGGVRKLRWQARGRGKSGGVRVIYYLREQVAVIWMLTIYAKSEASAIAPKVLSQIRREIESA